MATKSKQPIPEGMHTITTHLWFNNQGLDAIEFYKKAFNAVLIGEAISLPDCKSLMHAMLKIGNSHIMLADSFPDSSEQGVVNASTAGLWLYVEDCDLWFKRAVEEGCTEIMPMQDSFWGDRMGKIKDPFGHCWAIATHKYDMSQDEIKQVQQEWLESMSNN